MTIPSEPALRVGARVLLLNHNDEVLLIHARDPDDPGHHWWELPGGGQDRGEKLEDTARREIAEETGLLLNEIGRKTLALRKPLHLPRPRAPPPRPRLPRPHRPDRASGRPPAHRQRARRPHRASLVVGRSALNLSRQAPAG